MPLDVLEVIYDYIFRQPSNPDNDSRSGSGRISSFPGSYLTPLTLCHVDSRLRQAALQITMIWSSVYIYNIGPSQISLLRFWLNNASTRPLSIVVAFYKPTLEGWLFHSPIISELSKILGSKSHQWRSLSLRLPDYASGIFSGLRPGDVSSLKFVELQLEGWEPKRSDEIFTVLMSSSSLQEIDWSSTFGSDLPRNVPWERLTDLKLERPRTLHELIHVLDKAQNLRNLQLGELDDYRETAPQCITVNAQILTVTSPRIIDALFPSLSFPQLSELNIDVVEQRLSKEGWTILRTMTSDATQPHLRRFSYSSSLGDTNLLMIQNHFMNLLVLPRMVNLVHLVLHLSLTDILIQFLTHRPTWNSGAGFCTLPHLEVLSLSRCQVKSDGLISAMVLSRLSTNSPRSFLKHVDITVNGPGEFLKDKSAFEEFRRRGIDAHMLIW
ncbi:hypothetical protein GALMADRAFT_142707 [Galerina marginata CBS 339.88]|uniref:F-box domain-containing protein n=1 Tax=Galerina marginata (strain CBS 339.88) TaxID=685588 RepID=A0A067SSK7_GALM3|nr:hypothetical protein GALMADRAFT_142707 [Galerina marginata CBS 339.88]